jgi:hypothetical protein
MHVGMLETAAAEHVRRLRWVRWFGVVVASRRRRRADQDGQHQHEEPRNGDAGPDGNAGHVYQDRTPHTRRYTAAPRACLRAAAIARSMPWDTTSQIWHSVQPSWIAIIT